MNNNKYTKYAVIALIMLTFVLVWWTSRDKEKDIYENIILPNEETREKINYDTVELNFNDIIKKLFIALEEKDLNEAEYLGKQAHAQWVVLKDSYQGNQPRQFRYTKNWEGYLEETERLLEQVIKDIATLSLEEAIDKIKIIQASTLAARSENKIYDLRDKIIMFQEPVYQISAAGSKEETMQYLRDLKIGFTALKEEQADEKYSELMISLEETIGTIDKQLDGPELQGAQKELKELFLELYLLYG